jgi:hypothetical protein
MQTSILLLCLLLTNFTGSPQPVIKAPGTWILQIEGDSDGLQVAGATHKGFEFRAQRRLVSQYRVRLLDKAGKQLSSIPMDLTDFCLNPSHRGKKDHMRGDVIIQHKVVTTVKVPALPGVENIQITSLLGGKITVIGKIDRKSIITLTNKSKEVK